MDNDKGAVQVEPARLIAIPPMAGFGRRVTKSDIFRLLNLNLLLQANLGLAATPLDLRQVTGRLRCSS
jgi:hypothetical protein